MPSSLKKWGFFDQLPDCPQRPQQSREAENLPPTTHTVKREPVRKRAHDDSMPVPPSSTAAGHPSPPPPKTIRPPREFGNLHFGTWQDLLCILVPDWFIEFNMQREDVMKVLGVYGSTDERMLLIGVR